MSTDNVSVDVTADDASSSPGTRLWRQKPYLVWLASDTAKGLAGSLYSFALPLLVLLETDAPTKAGVVGAASLAASLVATLVGGVLADRHHRIRMMTWGALLGLGLSLVFLGLAVTGRLTFGVLLGLTVAFSLKGGTFDTAGEAALKEVVPGSMMGRAQAANQGRDSVLSMLGGPLGGLLLSFGAAFTAAAMTILNAVSAIAAGALGTLLRRPGTIPTAPQEDPDVSEEDADVAGEERGKSLVQEIGESLRMAYARRDLRAVLWIGTIVNLGLNAFITTIIYSLQQSGFTTVQIGMLSFAMGASMLIGAVLASTLVTRVRGGLLVISGIALAAAGSIVVVTMSGLPAISVTVAVSVILLPAVNAAMMGYMVVSTPSQYLGRFMSAMSVMIMAAMPLAPLIAGFGLAHLGRTGTLIVCSALCVVPAILALLSPAIRSLPVEAEWKDYAEKFVEKEAR